MTVLAPDAYRAAIAAALEDGWRFAGLHAAGRDPVNAIAESREGNNTMPIGLDAGVLPPCGPTPTPRSICRISSRDARACG